MALQQVAVARAAAAQAAEAARNCPRDVTSVTP
jgi:hypothetical protein